MSTATAAKATTDVTGSAKGESEMVDLRTVDFSSLPPSQTVMNQLVANLIGYSECIGPLRARKGELAPLVYQYGDLFDTADGIFEYLTEHGSGYTMPRDSIFAGLNADTVAHDVWGEKANKRDRQKYAARVAATIVAKRKK
jgi:hypothetical protein